MITSTAPAKPLGPAMVYRQHYARRWLSAIPASSLLEIGPGAATLALECAGRGHRVTVVDFDEVSCAFQHDSAEGRGVPTRVVCGDWRSLSTHFGVICAFEVLEHIEDDGRTIEEWGALLDDDGLLLLSVPAHMRHWSQSDVRSGHYRHYEREDLIELLVTNGFDIEDILCY